MLFNPVFLFFCLFVHLFVLVVIYLLVFVFFGIFFFYLAFRSGTFTIHMTAMEEGGYFFNSSLQLPPALLIKRLWCKLHGFLILRLSILRILVHASIINSKSCFCIFVFVALTCLLIYQIFYFLFIYLFIFDGAYGSRGVYVSILSFIILSNCMFFL